MTQIRRHFLIIYGAAVKENGVPSGSLLRRVQGAWKVSQGLSTECIFIVTGGVGKHPPSEAKVMQSLLLDMGASADQIILEEQATDTMQSSFFCVDILKRQGFNSVDDRVLNCSSPYHNYRCQLLLWMLGIPSKRGRMPSDKQALGTAKWLRYYLREMIAIPWDFIGMCWKRIKYKRM